MYKRRFLLPEQKEIEEYLNSIDYSNGFYSNSENKSSAIDQKCTFDIIYVNSKCIMNLIKQGKNSFSVNSFMNDEYSEILYSEKTSKNGKAVLSNKTKREYDKVFGNTLELFSYIKLLSKEKDGIKNKYYVENEKIIKKLSESEEACVSLISIHVFNLIKSNEKIIGFLEQMYNHDDYSCKQKFKFEIIKWIKDNSNRDKDSSQISCKLINPLFYIYNLKKYSSSTKVQQDQTLYDLSYFRVHKRDKNKANGLTRLEELRKRAESSSINKNELNFANVKKNITEWNKIYYNSVSTVTSEYSEEILENGHHCHHIWPIQFFSAQDNIIFSPNIPENIIILSQTEHLGIAHEKNKTNDINWNKIDFILEKQYQKIKNFNKNNVGNYKLSNFYILCCYIKNFSIENYDNISDEKLNFYIEELLSQKFEKELLISTNERRE